MPTLDELAPATAASDTDELLVSQAGIARKATRAQLLSGTQAALAVNSGVLLGRSSSGVGAPEAISIGGNLTLSSGVLSAQATPYVVNGLPAGTVPGPNDAVPLGQGGANVAIPYSQFMSALPSVPNIDASAMLVTPVGSGTSETLANFAGAMLPRAGGTMTGPLTLSADPAAAMEAATKEYVDGKAASMLPLAGGTLSGALILQGDPTSAEGAATKHYVDAAVGGVLPLNGGALAGPLSLAGDPTSALQAATKEYVDARVLRSGDTLTGPLTLAADPSAALQATTKQYTDAAVAKALPLAGGTLTGALLLSGDPGVALQAATKHYVDASVGSALPLAGGALNGALTLAADPVAPLQASTKEYVDTRVLRSGDAMTGALSLAADPVSSLQAATKNYVDTKVATALPISGGTVTGALTLSGTPGAPMQAAPKQYVDAQVATALPLAGGVMAGAVVLAANPTAPLQAAPKQYVDAEIATALPLAGGTLSGALTLAANPASALQAATKQYVDAGVAATKVINVQLPPYNAKLDGKTDDTAAFVAAYQAAPAGSVIYVPNGVTVLQNPSAWNVALTKRVKWIVDGTTLADGTVLASAIPTGTNPQANFLPGIVVGNSPTSAEVSQAASQPSDFSVQHSSYVVTHTGGTAGTVASNTRADTIIYDSPNNYIWGGLDRLVWAGTQTPSATTPAQHVGRYVQTIRQAATTDSSGKPLPQPQLWATCLEYRDATGVASSATNAAITSEMDWFGNGPDDANTRAVQSLVIGQNNTSGAPVEVSNIIGVWMGGGSTGHAYKVINVNIPFSTSVLDTTNAQQMTGAAAIRMAAGHAIAFEPTASYSLSFDAATSTLRWNQGTRSCVVGQGISVGWQVVVGGSYALAGYLAGNIVFLVGNSAPYTITLPPAASVAPGTGFTFSVLGTANVGIAPSGSDGIDDGPITLHQNDRYHVVSDGYAAWREIFHTNYVNPHFSGPPVLPSYTVAALPGGQVAGAKAFATNGRKPSEAAGAGTGVEVFFDGTHWVSCCSGTVVAV